MKTFLPTLLLSLPLSLLAPALGGCGSDTSHETGADSSGDSGDDSSSDSSTPLAPQILEVAISESDANPLARIVDVTLSLPGTIQLELSPVPGSALLKDFEALTETHSLPLIGLHADSVASLIVHATFEDGTSLSSEAIDVQVDPLPFEVPEFNFVVGMANDGIITTFALSEARGATIPATTIGIDRSGEVVWVGRHGRSTTGWTFYEELSDGTLIEFPAIQEDGEYRLYDIASITSDVITQWRSPYAIHHDGTVLPNGNLVAMHHTRRNVEVGESGEVNLLGDAFAESTPEGEVVWQWNTFDHLDTTRFPLGASQISSGDWTHGNSLDYLEETNELLVSFRNQNQIMTISRDSSEVTRTFGDDGDYTLTSGTWFKGQHQACLSPDGILTVFDNRYPSADSLNSRVVQYQIDEETKTAEQIWEVDLGHRYRSGGEASVLPNGHLRITAGGARRSEGATVQVLEYDENQELIWHVELPSDDIPMVFRSSQISAGQPVDR